MIDGKALSKPKLREEFSKNAEEHYKVKLFDDEGFSRHTCKICGKSGPELSCQKSQDT